LIRGELGHDIIPELCPLEGEPIIDKPGKGVFTYTDFDLLLRLKGVSNLVLCGVTTDVCVHTIMREANDRGYDCTLVRDACAAATPSLHAAALDMIESEGGIFGSTSTSNEIIESLKKS
jgi:nicotinamidase-related amidase